MMASQRNGTIYIGVTSDLVKRVWQHREGLIEGFTKKYRVKMLVWYEQHETMEGAIGKEKAMKKWLRKWKLSLIERHNPDWMDLWAEIIGDFAPVAPANPSVLEKVEYKHSVVPAHAGTQTAQGFPPSRE
jgi:putative endonuclease